MPVLYTIVVDKLKTMKLPKQLIICDIIWRIEVRKYAGKNTMGYCDINKRLIVILKGMSDFDSLSTLIHEVNHAIEFTLNIKIGHNIINKTEAPITSVIFQLFKTEHT